jgi:adenylate cyclase
LDAFRAYDPPVGPASGETEMASLFRELKRRNVFKVTVSYAIVSWLLIQVASSILPTFEAPAWTVRTITFLLILGFPAAVVLAWAYELTPEGIKRTPTLIVGKGSQAVAALSGRKSVLILPFENLSPNPGDFYFAAGIHEETLNQLQKVRDLTVIARTTALHFAGKSILDISQTLKVDAIVEGTVRYGGGRIRVTAFRPRPQRLIRPTSRR